jgi:hypothetical protein
LRATSLDTPEGEGDQLDVRSLQTQLEKTQELVGHLSKQLMELKDQVSFLKTVGALSLLITFVTIPDDRTAQAKTKVGIT